MSSRIKLFFLFGLTTLIWISCGRGEGKSHKLTPALEAVESANEAKVVPEKDLDLQDFKTGAVTWHLPRDLASALEEGAGDSDWEAHLQIDLRTREEDAPKVAYLQARFSLLDCDPLQAEHIFAAGESAGEDPAQEAGLKPRFPFHYAYSAVGAQFEGRVLARASFPSATSLKASHVEALLVPKEGRECVTVDLLLRPEAPINATDLRQSPVAWRFLNGIKLSLFDWGVTI